MSLFAVSLGLHNIEPNATADDPIQNEGEVYTTTQTRMHFLITPGKLCLLPSLRAGPHTGLLSPRPQPSYSHTTPRTILCQSRSSLGHQRLAGRCPVPLRQRVLAASRLPSGEGYVWYSRLLLLQPRASDFSGHAEDG